MNTQRLRPLLWIRLVVLAGFGVFVAYQSMWLLCALAAVLVAITVGQLIMAYR